MTLEILWHQSPSDRLYIINMSPIPLYERDIIPNENPNIFPFNFTWPSHQPFPILLYLILTFEIFQYDYKTDIWCIPPQLWPWHLPHSIMTLWSSYVTLQDPDIWHIPIWLTQPWHLTYSNSALPGLEIWHISIWFYLTFTSGTFLCDLPWSWPSHTYIYFITGERIGLVLLWSSWPRFIN